MNSENCKLTGVCQPKKDGRGFRRRHGNVHCRWCGMYMGNVT